MVKTVMKVTGLRELETALATLPRATAKNVLRRVAKGALDPMATDAANKAPRRTGKLAYSISVSEKRTGRAKWQAGRFKGARSTGIVVSMGPASGLGTLQYASFDEFGTIDTPAFAYMRSAWHGGKMEALEFVKQSLKEEIDRAVARVAKKKARASR